MDQFGEMGRLGSALLVLVRIVPASRSDTQTDIVNSTLVIKILIGVQLLSYATRRQAGMAARATADVVNDFGRDPIGEGKAERVGPFAQSLL